MYPDKRNIGLLGGSFNPAHAGHLHITLYALKHCKLDEVWWLVTPQNPLKKAEALADYAQRLAFAKQLVVHHPNIRVLDIENRLRTKYTYQTISQLQKRYKDLQFVWMMGADNLAQFDKWRRWREIAVRIPIIVFDRAPYSHRALRSKAAVALRYNRLRLSNIFGVWPDKGLLFMHMRRKSLSSTYLRKKLGKSAFLLHND